MRIELEHRELDLLEEALLKLVLDCRETLNAEEEDELGEGLRNLLRSRKERAGALNVKLRALRDEHERRREEAEERADLFRESARVYGVDREVCVAAEECGELTQALMKHLRYRDRPGVMEHLAEEIADVRLMTDKLILLFGCRDKVEEVYAAKCERLARRLEDARQGRGLERTAARGDGDGLR